MNKFTVWSNTNLNLDDWIDDLREYYPEMSDEDYTDLMYKINDDYLDDESCNLNIPIRTGILVLDENGLWYGKEHGYGVIDSFEIDKVGDLLEHIEHGEYYVSEDDEFCRDEYHHDGMNIRTYRLIRDDLTAEQEEDFYDKMYNHNLTDEIIDRCTIKMGQLIRNVYGV